MKKSILTFLMISISTYASLEDAYNMQQTSPGKWVVVCKDGSRSVNSTFDILKNAVCGVADYTQDCFDQAVATIPSYDYNDTNEIKEIQDACSSATLSTGACYASAIAGVKTFDINERDEVISVIDACTLGSRRNRSNGSISECIDLAKNNIKSYDYDGREESLEIVVSCSMGTAKTTTCVQAMIDSLPSYQYDSRAEMISIIQNCY